MTEGHQGTCAVALAAFAAPQELAAALAARVGEAVSRRLARDGAASIAVSGGRTPVRFLSALARSRLDWSRVAVTLVDERWVPETSERSNAALVRRHLLTGPAQAARFVPLFSADAGPEAGCAAAAARITGLPQPFAAVVLGMGDDGHTASFFPHAEGLAAAIDPHAPAVVTVIRAAAAGEPRISLTLPMLLAADTLLLHIEGMRKREVLERACLAGAVEDMPIRAVLRRCAAPLEVMWCP